ncbi:hypothetical protein KAR91_64810, partial [Candidatus Pacearchaeota archaeon]|nr:hypothetical protein [Candidatus Pacearchaeota archaeon]
MAFGDIIQNESVASGTPDVDSITASLPSTPTEGNLLLALHFTGNENSIGPSGWDFAVGRFNSSNNDEAAIYYKVAGSAESKDVTCGSDVDDQHVLTALEVEGPWNAAPFDESAGYGPTNTNNPSSGTTGTTAQADEFAAALLASRSQADHYSAWTNSFIERSDLYGSGKTKTMGTATRVLTTSSTYETSATSEKTAIKMGLIATFMKQDAGVDVTPSAAVAGADSVDPTVELDINLTPTESVASVSSSISAVGQSSMGVTVSAASASCSIGAPSVVLGDINLSPSPSTIVTSKSGPQVVQDSLAISPSAVFANTAKTDPVVQQGTIQVDPESAIASADS